MTRILSLLQIKTARSAWVFLVGSGLLFVFGAYMVGSSSEYSPGDPREHFEITFFSFWFLVVGLYMVIASWVLFSENGREYLGVQKQTPAKGKRKILWYLKFLIACYAAAYATIMLIVVLSLPSDGTEGIEMAFSQNSGVFLLVAGFIWSPLIYLNLK